MPKNIDDLFWGKVDKTGECWLWTGVVSNAGYGRIKRKDKQLSTHRYSYWLEYGDFDTSKYVCHRCDVPLCVRPSHLFLGTPRDNMLDMVSKSRNANLNGVERWNSKLNNDIVINIRESYRSKRMNQYQLAKLYGVNQCLISRLVNKKRWSHI